MTKRTLASARPNSSPRTSPPSPTVRPCRLPRPAPPGTSLLNLDVDLALDADVAAPIDAAMAANANVAAPIEPRSPPTCCPSTRRRTPRRPGLDHLPGPGRCGRGHRQPGRQRRSVRRRRVPAAPFSAPTDHTDDGAAATPPGAPAAGRAGRGAAAGYRRQPDRRVPGVGLQGGALPGPPGRRPDHPAHPAAVRLGGGDRRPARRRRRSPRPSASASGDRSATTTSATCGREAAPGRPGQGRPGPGPDVKKANPLLALRIRMQLANERAHQPPHRAVRHPVPPVGRGAVVVGLLRRRWMGALRPGPRRRHP